MPETGRLELDILDVYGMRLSEPVTVSLRHRTLQERRRADRVDVSHPIAIGELRCEPLGLYILEINAPSYQPVRRFVTIPATGVRREQVILPIRADRARPLFPPYEQLDERVQGILDRSKQVRGHEGLTGPELYAALSDEAKAGLLNIAKKSLATEFRDGADLLPHLVLLDVLGALLRRGAARPDRSDAGAGGRGLLPQGQRNPAPAAGGVRAGRQLQDA
jgi:hypothetical protein